MKRLMNKIRSEKGASIILALLLFLICGFVSAVTVGAAVTSLRSYERQRRDQKVYLSVSSAAQLLRDAVSGVQVAGEESHKDYVCEEQSRSEYADMISITPGYEPDEFKISARLQVVRGDSRLSAMISDGAYKVYRSKARYPNNWVSFSSWQKEIVITAQDMNLFPVRAVMTMEENYNITVRLRADSGGIDGEEYAMTLKFAGDVSVTDKTLEAGGGSSESKALFCHHTVKYEFIEDGITKEREGELSGKNKLFTTTTTITWQDGEIRKGA